MDPRVLWSRIFKIAPFFDIFWNTKYCQNEPRFNGVYSRDNLHDKIKDASCLINLVEYFDIETHRIALYALNSNFSYFDSFGVKHISKEIKKFIDKFRVVKDNFRIQAYDSIMCA